MAALSGGPYLNEFVVAKFGSGKIGVNLSDAPAGAKELGGVVVSRVEAGSQAARYSVREGDVVVGVGAEYCAYGDVSSTSKLLKRAARPMHVTFARMRRPTPEEVASPDRLRLTSGDLQKQSRSLFHTWKRRKFVIFPHQMLIKDHADTTLVTLSMRDILQWYASKSGDRYFNVKTPEREYALYCSADCERVQWLYCFDQAKRSGGNTRALDAAVAAMHASTAPASAGADPSGAGGLYPAIGGDGRYRAGSGAMAPPTYDTARRGSGASMGSGSFGTAPPAYPADNRGGGSYPAPPRTRAGSSSAGYSAAVAAAASAHGSAAGAGAGPRSSFSAPVFSDSGPFNAYTTKSALLRVYSPLRFVQLRVAGGEGQDGAIASEVGPEPDTASLFTYDFATEHRVMARPPPVPTRTRFK